MKNNMKIALLNDVHFGCRNNSEVFHKEHIFRFFEEVFFDYLKRHDDIKDVFILGDFVENRKVINIQTIKWIQDYFFEPCKKLNLKLHALAGNHDCFYREQNHVNVYQELWKDKFETIVDNSAISWNNIDVIPWINTNNLHTIADFIESSHNKYAFGHFNISGAVMFKNVISSSGMPLSVFSRYKKVLTGHFHEKSTIGNIEYLGNQYDTNWSEYCPDGKYKGFHVFDTDTGTLEFIKNPDKCHVRIVYDDSLESSNPDDYDVRSKIVKVIIKNKKSPGYFQRFIENLEKQNYMSLITTDEYVVSFDRSNDNEIQNLDIKNEEELIVDYINNDIVSDSIDKKRLLQKTMELYKKAKEVQK